MARGELAVLDFCSKRLGAGGDTESGGRRKATVDVGYVRNTKSPMGKHERVTKTRNSHSAS